jgi:hypothetical protein
MVRSMSARRGVGQVLVVRVAGHFLHPVQVRAGAEGRAVRGQHDRAHQLVAAQFIEGQRQFGDRVSLKALRSPGGSG